MCVFIKPAASHEEKQSDDEEALVFEFLASPRCLPNASNATAGANAIKCIDLYV
jgi:hypothetical protein